MCGAVPAVSERGACGLFRPGRRDDRAEHHEWALMIVDSWSPSWLFACLMGYDVWKRMIPFCCSILVLIPICDLRQDFIDERISASSRFVMMFLLFSFTRMDPTAMRRDPHANPAYVATGRICFTRTILFCPFISPSSSEQLCKGFCLGALVSSHRKCMVFFGLDSLLAS